MKRSNLAAIAGLSALLTAALIGVWLTTDDRKSTAQAELSQSGLPPTQAHSATQSPAITLSDRASTNGIGNSHPAANNSVVELSPSRKFGEATDLRQFAEFARAQTGPGWRFYEQVALRTCRSERQLLTESSNLPGASITDHAAASRREAAKRIIERRCGGFIDSELAVERALTPEAIQRSQVQDPYLTALADAGEAIRADNTVKLRDAFDRIFETGDGALIRSAPLGLSREGRYFDGQLYRSAAELSIYDSAVALVGCSFGESCGAEDSFVLDACVNHGLCAEDRAGAMRIVLMQKAGLSEPAIRQMAALSASMVEAIRQRDAAKFVPPAK
jgi:uncharacterized protein (DUF1778 family)